MINQPTPNYNTVMGKLKLLPPNISGMLCIIHCLEVLSRYSTEIADDRRGAWGSTFDRVGVGVTDEEMAAADAEAVRVEAEKAAAATRLQAIARGRGVRREAEEARLKAAAAAEEGKAEERSGGGGDLEGVSMAPIGRADSKILDNVKISKYIQYIINYYKTLDYNVFNLKIFIENTAVSDGQKECFLQISFDDKDFKIDNINAYIIMTNIMYNDNQKLKDKFGEDINLIKKLRSEINNVFFMDKELSSKAKGKYERTFASAKKFSERKYDQIGIIKNLIGARKCERRRRRG